MKKKFLGIVLVTIIIGVTFLGMATVIRSAQARNTPPTTGGDKGADSVIVETMRSCIITVASQGLTNQGVDQAYRLCWNRAELVGKTRKEK